MKTYELTYAFQENLDEKEVAKTADQFQKSLTDIEVEKQDLWGKRKLVYQISKNNFGYFVSLIFKTAPENLSKIEKKLKQKEEIIRYLIVKAQLPKTVKPKKEKESATADKEEVKSLDETRDKEEKTEISAKPPLDSARGKKKKVEKTAPPEKTEEKKTEKEEPKVKIIAKTPVKKAKEKAPITKEIEAEEKKMKDLDEKLDEILKE